MKALQPYLNFDGTTRDAMNFYKECLGGTLFMQSFGEAQPGSMPGGEERIMHARLETGPAILMASDTMPGQPFVRGTSVHINIDCESVEEIERLFAALSAGGAVTIPLQDTF